MVKNYLYVKCSRSITKEKILVKIINSFQKNAVLSRKATSVWKT